MPKSSFDIKNITFTGGGSKAFAYSGALNYMEEKHLLDNVEAVSGSSAGGLFASFVAFGMTGEDIFKMTNGSFNLNMIQSGTNETEKTWNLFTNGWVYSGKYLKENIIDSANLALKNLGFDIDLGKITFGELHALHEQDSRFKELYLTGTKMPEKTLEIFSAETTPDMPIIKALTITSAFPVFLQPQEYNGVIYVDGGLADNSPFRIFEKIDPVSGKAIPNPETLVLVSTNSKETASDYFESLIENFGTLDIQLMSKWLPGGVMADSGNYYHLLETLIDQLNLPDHRAKLPDYMLDQTVFLELHGTVQTLNTNVPTETLKTLYDLGYQGAAESFGI